MDVDDEFDLDMATVTKCKRMQHGKCPGDPHTGPHAADLDASYSYANVAEAVDYAYEELVLDTFGRAGATTLLDQAEVAAAIPAVKLAAAAEKAAETAAMANSGDLPTFPQDYTSHESVLQLLNQNGKNDAAGNTCCSMASAGQCQVRRHEQFPSAYIPDDVPIT